MPNDASQFWRLLGVKMDIKCGDCAYTEKTSL